jgi:micrococcal nuclease
VRRRLGILLALVALAACGGEQATSGSSPSKTVPSKSAPSKAAPGGRDATIERIVDGDTIVVAGNEKVRLIGIDTPETKDPRRPVQCFGAEATRHITRLIPPGSPVVLARDVSTTDRFGRTLAYVYRARDGLFVNAEMVRNGFAATATFPPDVVHASEFVALEREARDAGRGLWAACGGPDVPA